MSEQKLRVTVTGPIIRRSDGILLKVSAHAFKENPRKVYTLVRSPFWMDLIKHGFLMEVVDDDAEPKSKPGPKPKHEAKE